MREFGTEFVVLVDVDLLEERLVAQAPVGVVAERVDGVAVLEEIEAVVQIRACFVVAGMVLIEPSTHFVEFGRDAILVASELGHVDRVCEVELQDLVLLFLEPIAIRHEKVQFLRCCCLAVVEVCVDSFPECLLDVLADLDSLVVVEDESFDFADEHRLAVAVGSPGVAS